MRKFFYMIIVCLFVACGDDVNHKGKTPVAFVGDNYLYLEDIKNVIPLQLSGKDSIEFVDDYIRKWAEDIVFYNMAKSNIANEKDIDEYVENYRRSLIINGYQERLVREKLDVCVSDEEIMAYYNRDKSIFLLDKPLVKGVYIKVPVNNRDLRTVRKRMNFRHEEDRDWLENFTLRGAADYLYFMDNWEELSETSQRLPQQIDIKSFTDIKHLYEFRDSAYVYMLYVDSLIRKGDYMPFELAYNDIREVIYNERKATYIKEIRKELYEKAVDNNKIKILR